VVFSNIFPLRYSGSDSYSVG